MNCVLEGGGVSMRCVCQILREIKPMERMCVYVTKSYMLNRVFTQRLCVRDRERCAGLEVGRGRVRGQNVCVDACVTCDRARDGRSERDGCCVTDDPLSLSLAHT